MSEGPFTGLRQAFVGSRPAPASKAPDTGAGAGPTAHTGATSVPLGLPTHHLDAPLCPKEGHCVQWGPVCPPRPPAVSTQAIRAARAARESGTRAHLAGPRSGSCARRSAGGLAQGLGGRWSRKSCRRYPENTIIGFAYFHWGLTLPTHHGLGQQCGVQSCFGVPRFWADRNGSHLAASRPVAWRHQKGEPTGRVGDGWGDNGLHFCRNSHVLSGKQLTVVHIVPFHVPCRRARPSARSKRKRSWRVCCIFLKRAPW